MSGKPNPSIVLLGGVASTTRTLKALMRHRMEVRGVLGLVEAKAGTVCGFDDLARPAQAAGIPYREFQNVNEPEVVEFVRNLEPDLLFVVGLSQLVKSDLLSVPSMGAVGFHPTRLPKGRGRAPVAWLALDGGIGASNFFVINEGVDAGPILARSEFEVGPEDDAQAIYNKLLDSIDSALDDWLPRLRIGEWTPVPQEESEATYHGKREPVDGILDWNRSAEELAALIRAASRPHPGAYTFHRGHPLIIWRSKVEVDSNFRGVVGRVLHITPEGHLLVQAGRGVIRVTEYEVAQEEGARVPRVGDMLGYLPQHEIHGLRRRVAVLERELAELKGTLRS